MLHLSGQANAEVDIGVEDVDQEVDDDDHHPGFHDDAPHQREIALEDPLVQEPSDAGPGKDDFDDDGGVQHDDKVDPGQGEDRDQRVLKGVDRDDRIAG